MPCPFCNTQVFCARMILPNKPSTEGLCLLHSGRTSRVLILALQRFTSLRVHAPFLQLVGCLPLHSAQVCHA
jgi:hypothetical protein